MVILKKKPVHFLQRALIYSKRFDTNKSLSQDFEIRASGRTESPSENGVP